MDRFNAAASVALAAALLACAAPAARAAGSLPACSTLPAPSGRGRCETCTSSSHCAAGKFCCPYMKKCVGRGESCYTPTAGTPGVVGSPGSGATYTFQEWIHLKNSGRYPGMTGQMKAIEKTCVEAAVTTTTAPPPDPASMFAAGRAGQSCAGFSTGFVNKYYPLAEAQALCCAQGSGCTAVTCKAAEQCDAATEACCSLRRATELSVSSKGETTYTKAEMNMKTAATAAPDTASKDLQDKLDCALRDKEALEARVLELELALDKARKCSLGSGASRGKRRAPSGPARERRGELVSFEGVELQVVASPFIR